MPSYLSVVALVLSLWTALSLAQQSSPESALDAYPDCAVPCIMDAFEQQLCAPADRECICTDETYRSAVTACVTQSCIIPDIFATRNTSLANCGSPLRDRSAELIHITIPFVVAASIFVVLRFSYIVFAKLGLALDDWLMLACLLVTIPSAVLNTYGLAHSGQGKDIWALTHRQITDTLRYFLMTAWLYFLATAFVKMSIVAFYLRIFPQQRMRRVLWATFAFIAAWGLVFVLFIIFQCRPVSYFYTRWDGLQEGTCLNGNNIAWAHAGINIGLDTWIIAIPLRELPSLQLHWKRKIGIAFMFCLGIFVTITSCLRLRSLVSLSQSFNKTWEYLDVTTWSTIELNVSIICGCLPSARLLVIRLVPRLGSQAHAAQSSQSTGSYAFKPRSRAAFGFRSRSPHGNSIHITALDSPQEDSDDNNSGSGGGGGIKTQKTFRVSHAENDEASLVPMHHMGLPGKSLSDV